ncbi:MAG TPA: hypothetical protein VEU62_07880 [Bryobacterales bacterium]|nr:hypothetical protein [Bryobacterales bacterium]
MSSIRLLVRQEPFVFPPEIERDPRLDRWVDPVGRECGFSLERDGQHWICIYQLGAFIVQPGYSEVLGFPDAGVETERFQDVFFRLVAPWLINRKVWDCLHASAVLSGSGVVIFCGPSGRGKSTLARACAERGAAPYADDAVPFLIRDGVPLAAHIPHRLRLRDPAASWFNDAPRPSWNGNRNGEILYDLEGSLRPISAIYWLERRSDAGEHPVPLVERISTSESFRLLLAEAYCLTLTDGACNRKMVDNYLALARLASVFQLSFASGREQIPAVLDCLEQNQKQLMNA